MIHIQIVERLVEQHVLRVLRDDHGDERPLLLTPAEFIEEFVLHRFKVHIANCLVYIGFVFLIQASLRIGKTPKVYEIPHRQPNIDVIGLLKN
ncbi:hypothetical protein D3C76_1629280 [compost metagenome]